MKNRFLVRNEANEKAAVMSIRGRIDSYWDDSNYTVTDTEEQILNELKQIPEGKKIDLHVNSEGGSVQLALGIHNALRTRAKDITVVNDGYMLSSATLLPPPGSRVMCPKSSVYMIHKPSAGYQGNEDGLKAFQDMLRAHQDAMTDIYAERTGKSKEEISRMMSAETWMTGSEAVDEGFADEGDVEPDEDDSPVSPAPTSAIDPRIMATFKNVPDRFKPILAAAAPKSDPTFNDTKRVTGAATADLSAKEAANKGGKSATPNNQTKGTKMTKIITALVAAGVSVPADATEDQLVSALNGVIAERKSLTDENKELKTKAEADRVARITAHVNARTEMPEATRNQWIGAMTKDESVQALFDAIPAAAKTEPKAPRGAAPAPAVTASGNSDAELDNIREQMKTEKDPSKLAAMAIQARNLRGHKDLFVIVADAKPETN